MPRTHLVIFHTENCLLHPNENLLAPSDHLLASNLNLVRYERDLIELNDVNNVIMAELRPSDTLKQSAIGMLTLPILQQHFANIFPKINVVFDPFWHQGDETAQEKVNDVVKDFNFSGTTQTILNRQHIADIIALAHRAAAAFPKDDLTINIYTGSKEHYQSLETFFQKQTQALPNNVSILSLLRITNNDITGDECEITDKLKTNIVTWYNTNPMYTTAAQWQIEKKIKAGLVPTPDKTNELLTENPIIHVVEEPIKPAPSAAVTNAGGGFWQLFQPKSDAQPSTTHNADVLKSFESAKADYRARQITSEQLLKYARPFQIRDKNSPEPTEIQLVQALKAIAHQPLWQNKHKSLNSLLARTTSSEASSQTIPDGVKKIADSEATTFAKLAELVKDKVGQHKSVNKFGFGKAEFIYRSHATVNFYELIVAMDSRDTTLSNHAKEVVINEFCKKIGLNYPEILNGSTMQQQARIRIN